jgi:hypothetical protein
MFSPYDCIETKYIRHPIVNDPAPYWSHGELHELPANWLFLVEGSEIISTDELS